MVHVHGAQAQQLAEPIRGLDPAELVAVPVDVGKHTAMALVCDFTGELLARPFAFPMTMAGVRLLVERVQAATCGRAIQLVRVGVEAAGHYHQPLTSAGVLPADWQLVQVSPAQVAAQRQLAGRRRVKTDALDLVAISDLLRAGHGADRARLSAVMGELAAWVAHRERRVTARTARAQEPAAWAGRSGLPWGQRLCLQPVRDQGRPAGPGRVHRPGPAQRAGWPASSRPPPSKGCRSWARWPSGWSPPLRWRSRPTRPRSPGPSSTATAPCWPPSTPRSPRPTSTWPPCCRGPRSPCCAAVLAGGWSGRPPMAPRSATQPGGPAPGRCIGPAGCAQRPTPRPAVRGQVLMSFLVRAHM